MLWEYILFAVRTREFRQYVKSVIELIFHFVGSTVLFLTLVVLAWGMSWGVASLQAAHPFSTQLQNFFNLVELYLVYGDSLLFASVISVGAYRIIMKGWEATK